MFKEGNIEGIIVRKLNKYTDERGWLIELFRNDELDKDYFPVMSYISMTSPGVVRGPHEHADQTDLFGFIGPSTFKVYLWDTRKNSPTYMKKQSILVGESNPSSILVPPRIVHAYKNVGSVPGMVVNYPNRLFGGKWKKEKVDEIRHENDPNTIFIID
jgi:dTDP-4-dehydrorhamnose 3,5-epimerase